MESNDSVYLEERANGIALLTLNRPEKHNIFDAAMINALLSNFHLLNENPKVRVILLHANGLNFSAGADLERMHQLSSLSEEENYQDALQLAHVLKSLREISKPTIALVHGSTYGGGLGLIACCDIVIAADSAKFCFSEVKLGLIPAIISPYIISAIGYRYARYYFLTADLFDAGEAVRIGFAHQVVPASALVEEGLKLASKLLQNGPKSLEAVKRLVDYFQHIDDEIVRMTASWNAKIRKSEEGQEGIKAFFEKRKPVWFEKM